MKLRITPNSQRGDLIDIIAEGSGRIICSMRYEDLALAQRMVRRENGWWHTIFGDGRHDEKQKAYDKWMMERSP